MFFGSWAGVKEINKTGQRVMAIMVKQMQKNRDADAIELNPTLLQRTVTR